MSDPKDPTRSTSASMTREAFIGISAGAGVAAASLVGAAGAADASLGKPHAPLVPDNDPSLDARPIELVRPDAVIQAYAAFERHARPAAPGIVIVPHIWGVDSQIRDVVRRFAKAGYVTVSPNLFSRQNAPSGDGATDFRIFRAFAQKLESDQVVGDIVAAAAWIRKRTGVDENHRPPKIGITGFCMGGGIALSVASNTTVFDALAMWYGQPSVENAAKLQIPVLGSFGERDTSIPASDVREFEKRLKVPHDVKIYPEAGHAFFDDTRQSYVPTAAADAWTRTLAWFAKYLM